MNLPDAMKLVRDLRPVGFSVLLPAACPGVTAPSHDSGERHNAYRSTARAHGIKKLLREGFTLMELLVVIVIIAILIAVLFPLVNSALGQGKSAGCMSNLKQLHAFTERYVATFGKYPLMGRQEANSSGQVVNIVDENFYHHLEDAAVAVCPSAKFKGKNNIGIPFQAYGSNPMVIPYSYSSSGREAVRPAQIFRPMELVLLADCPQIATAPIRVLGYSMAWYIGPESGMESRLDEPLTDKIIPETGFWDDIPLMPRRHLGRANIVFADGHTGSIKATSELTERNYFRNY